MPTYDKNRTASFFHFLSKILYFSSGHDFWFEDLELPESLVKFFGRISKIIDLIVLYFIFTGWGSLYTQKYLTQKQSNSVVMYNASHTFGLVVHISILYYKLELRALVYTLAVRLRGMSSDEPTERIMIKTASRYVMATMVVIVISILSGGINSGVQSITSNATFTTIIPIWPDIEDRRLIASVARIIYYIFWWITALRCISTHLIIIVITICLSHQFRILCKYFENLDNIFEGSGSQEEKEQRYEDAFKFGIKMHSITLWCTKQLQKVGSVTFSTQVIINVTVLMLVMLQTIYTERTLLALMPLVFLAATVLILTGVFMWNAGDITIEASQLPNAQFFSGWHNCQRQAAVRVRKLVTIAMTQAQEPVFISCFGVINLSYEFYVKIVKSSYSLFSVIY